MKASRLSLPTSPAVSRKSRPSASPVVIWTMISLNICASCSLNTLSDAASHSLPRRPPAMSLDVLLSTKVDVEHPWLGLESFDESTRPYFFGRDAEAAELLQRLRLHPLLVFYGRSG